MVAVTLVVVTTVAFPANGQSETFWHDQITKEEWRATKEKEAWIKEQAAACIGERLRVSDAHSQSVSYLDRRDRTLGGGYVGSGIIMREEKRIQRIVYRAFDQINAISYSLGERADPAAECKAMADTAILEIRAIIERYP
jgi:hypothetical protein